MNDFATLPDLIAYQDYRFNNSLALNFKENGIAKSFSNQDLLNQVFAFACGLREIGLKKGDFFGNYSYQNPTWLIADFGAILAGAITVPIFENISKENLLYQIDDANVSFIFTDKADFTKEGFVKDRKLKIISYNFYDENAVGFGHIIDLGKRAIEQQKYKLETFLKECAPGDLATIIYTSGSTGKPKGVELTHHNLVSQIKDTKSFFALDPENDVALSFLPLAHIFERMVMMFYISQGISVYFADDIKNIGASLKEFTPSIMTTVPRMLEKVFAKIKENIESASFIKKFLGRKALQRALTKDVNEKDNFLDKIFDLLIYKKLRLSLGGKMRAVICGGAALSLDLQKFYKNIKINVFCGYGLTETSPVIATNCPKANKIGSVGKVYPSVQIKIAIDGELLVRGENIMRGYHNKPEKTAEVMQDGWFKTGDLARIDGEGFLVINGRKKELFKNANGKYVAPTAIEQKLVQELGFLLGAVVIAEGKQFTSALLFVDFELLKKFKEKLSFDGCDDEFLKSEILQKFCQNKINEINESLNNWEKVQKFYIATDHISIDSGEITPSMKLKRNILEEKYQNQIEEFYKA